MGHKVPGVPWGPPAPRSMSTSYGQSEVKVTVIYHHTNKQVQVLGLMKENTEGGSGGRARNRERP